MLRSLTRPLLGLVLCLATIPFSLAQTLLISNVDVLTMSGPEPVLRRAQSVLVEDGVITAIGVPDQMQVPPDLAQVDGGGGTLMPGLIDAHVHVWDWPELKTYLSYGLTTVRNMSGMPYLLDYQRQLDAGELIGPRLLTTGPILNSAGPNQQLNHQLVETAEQARAAVRWQHASGYRALKVYSNLNREAYQAILEQAAVQGMAITGHPPEGRREPGIPLQRPFNIGFEELLDDGFQTLEHVESITWHALRDQLDSEALAALAGQLAAAGVTVTPTLLAHHNLVRAATEKGAFVTRPGVELINPFLAQLEQPGIDGWVAMPAGTRTAHDAFYGEAARVFAEAGVRLVAGSDAGIFVNIPGQSLLDELSLLRRAGLSPYQVLRSATVDAAEALGLTQVGQVAVGYRAELLLLPGNPLDDPDRLAQPTGLLYPGGWLDAGALQALRQQALAEADAARTEAQAMAALQAQQQFMVP